MSLQFDPERFVDGLLGIGAAGGQSKSNANEGAMLAARLDSMRKERDERAKVIKRTPVAAAVAPQQPEFASVDVGTDEAERSSGSRQKKKKNKKRKNKK